MQPAPSLDELRRRFVKFMQLEEVREFRNQARAEASGDKGKEEMERQNRPAIGRGDRRKDNWGHRFVRYTPLSLDRENFLDEALSVELIPPPRRVASLENADRTRRCWYHRNSGHTTDECQALKDKIKKLIQAGHLRRFVQRSRGAK